MDYGEIRELIKEFNDSKLSRLEIEFDGAKVKLEKASEEPVYMYGPAAGAAHAVANPEAGAFQAVSRGSAAAPAFEGHCVTAPIVGTFYQSSSPEKPPFVRPGDSVKPGDVLCIIEAMKIMNEIVCDRAGKIAEVCAKDGAMVEFGQALFKIKEV
ncbi:MAG: acetyl-CoA carboxylase biotin carboxyl carrier protein [Firmicutes bacterium]|nr:acetyl-CoA carboxylase biotin carboxyl carrier protein [Bacillota bacterium]